MGFEEIFVLLLLVYLHGKLVEADEEALTFKAEMVSLMFYSRGMRVEGLMLVTC